MVRPALRAAFLLGFCAFASSCSSADPTAPAADTPSTDATEALSVPVSHDGALGIDDMLDDALFRGAIASVGEETLLKPLLAAVDALDRGQVVRAAVLLAEARHEADELLDGPLTETLIAWSVIERYLEEAELL